MKHEYRTYDEAEFAGIIFRNCLSKILHYMLGRSMQSSQKNLMEKAGSGWLDRG